MQRSAAVWPAFRGRQKRAIEALLPLVFPRKTRAKFFFLARGGGVAARVENFVWRRGGGSF